MTDSNNTEDPLESSLTISAVKRLLSQHIRSLAQAGVETLPHGLGRFQFEFEASNSAEVVAAVAPDVSPNASQVHEAVSERYHSGENLPNPSSTNSSTDSANANSDSAQTGAQPVPAPQSAPRPPAAIPEDQEPYGQSLPMSERTSSLAVLQTEVANCTRCNELSACRTQTVFGVGNVVPRLVFLGEGPGADEDKTGEPFVGAAGQLLNKIMTASKIKREEVYILNSVKCRPPNNRNPTPRELDNCWQYAVQQLEILQPEFICCLGSVAAKRLLNSGLALGSLRGQFHSYRSSRVLVTYHPAYLLKTGSTKTKRLVWDDMKTLMKEMGIEL